MRRLLSLEPQGYGVPALISVVLHLVLVLFLLSGWSFNLQKPDKKPEHIQAKLVTLAPKGPSAAEIKQQQLAEQKRKAALERKRQIERQKKADAKRRADAKRKAEAKKKAEAAAKRKAEAKRQLAIKQKAEAKRKADLAKKEQAKRQAEAKRKAELEKKAEQQRLAKLEAKKRAEQKAREQAALDAEMSALLAAEEADRERAAAQAASEAELVAGYSELIRDQVAAQWSRPPSARNDMEVTLLVQLVPTGEVVDVQVFSSSGNEAFDRSALQAVRLAARIPELQDLSARYPRLFEREFRRLKLKFSPEDLLL